MTNLPDILSEALSRIEPHTEARMETLIAEFSRVPLSGEDRLSALAGTIATVAHIRYVRHRSVFIEALRGWALEITNLLGPRPSLLGPDGMSGNIHAAQSLLMAGIDGLLRSMVAAGTHAQHRLVAELALLVRLLGRHDAATIHLVITAVKRALADPEWQCGDRVTVLLREQTEQLTPTAALERLAPRGTA